MPIKTPNKVDPHIFVLQEQLVELAKAGLRFSSIYIKVENEIANRKQQVEARG